MGANQRNKGITAAEQLSDFINSASQQDMHYFVNALLSDHRDLQQKMFSTMVLPIIEGNARNHVAGYYDARNEHAAVTSRRIATIL